MKTETVEVEECDNCHAPDPEGLAVTESSGPNRGKTFKWCRTCWETMAISVSMYPGHYSVGTSRIIQVMCNIEQRRRLKDGYYD